MIIRFLKTTDNAMKLRRIGASLEYYFLKKRKVLITVPSEAAAQYLDDFLWKQPKESFLPHVFSQTDCTEEIVMTTGDKNINGADVLINLCPNQSPIAEQFKIIYELWDETDESRRVQSEKKYQAYQTAGCDVELLP